MEDVYYYLLVSDIIISWKYFIAIHCISYIAKGICYD